MYFCKDMLRDLVETHKVNLAHVYAHLNLELCVH